MRFKAKNIDFYFRHYSEESFWTKDVVYHREYNRPARFVYGGNFDNFEYYKHGYYVNPEHTYIV
jgi:hypothetical protein